MPRDDSHEFVAVRKTQGVHARRVHPDRRVMDQHEHRNVALCSQRALELLELRRAEPALAVRGLGEPGTEQHDGPRADAVRSANQERRATEPSLQFGRHVVIARDHQDRRRARSEQQLERPVSRGIVLHQVASERHGVGREVAPCSVRQTRLQPRQRDRPAQLAVRIGQQVGVGELQETRAVHRGTIMSDWPPAEVAPCRIVRSPSRIRSTSTCCRSRCASRSCCSTCVRRRPRCRPPRCRSRRSRDSSWRCWCD